MMAKYIDREAALSMREPPKSNRCYQTDNLDDAYGQGWDDALCCLERLPTADVAPVVHGEWLEDEHTYPGAGLRNNLCSVCGKIAGSWRTGLERGRKWPYCPNCGAKMDGGDDN